jgi:hypothetical protein
MSPQVAGVPDLIGLTADRAADKWGTAVVDAWARSAGFK